MPGSADAAPAVGNQDAAPRSAADAALPPDADPSAPTATLVGNVTRSTEPQAGGVGSIYIAIFDQDPVAGSSDAAPVATTVLTNADMSAGDAAIAYEVVGIPPRADPYFIVAFLDDNNNVDASSPEAAGPDRGDLVSLQGLSSPSVVLSTPTETTMAIVLNIAMPF